MSKRGYYGVCHPDADYGFAIIANNGKQAKQLLYDYQDVGSECEWNWIDIRIKWNKDAKVEHLPIGVITDLRIGLECGIFAYISDFECDKCGCEGDVQLYKGKVLCESCYDKAIYGFPLQGK